MACPKAYRMVDRKVLSSSMACPIAYRMVGRKVQRTALSKASESMDCQTVQSMITPTVYPKEWTRACLKEFQRDFLIDRMTVALKAVEMEARTAEGKAHSMGSTTEQAP